MVLCFYGYAIRASIDFRAEAREMERWLLCTLEQSTLRCGSLFRSFRWFGLSPSDLFFGYGFCIPAFGWISCTL
jgi:hypothetical protein